MTNKAFLVRDGLRSGSTLVINSAGSWVGNTITEVFGGTGQTTYAIGDILFASAPNTLSKLPKGAAGQVLTMGSPLLPSWQTAIGGSPVPSHTHDGIADADLLDKSASEAVSGAWNFPDAGIFIEAKGKLYHSGSTFRIQGLVNSNTFQLSMANSAGVEKALLFGDPNDGTGLYFAGSEKLVTLAGGVSITGDVGGTTIGGITEANLVDKSAAESITARWTFESNPEINNTSPALRFVDNNAAADETRFTIRYQSGQVRFQNRTDLDAGPVNWLTMDRTGVTTDDITLNATTINLTGAVSATSYGGIPEANLVNKAAAEVITGGHTFESNNFGTALIVGRTSSTLAIAIAYQNNDGIKGYTGFNDAKEFVVSKATTGAIFSVTESGSVKVFSHLRIATYTTAQLEDVTHEVNTSADKVLGAMVVNSTTKQPLWAFGDADNSSWRDAQIAVKHSPV